MVWAVALGAVALLATSCQRVEVTTYDASKRPALALHYLTRDGADRYTTKAGRGTLRVSAPGSNRGIEGNSNTRAVIWPPGTKPVVEQSSCARFTDARGAWVQQGLVLRFRIDGSRVRSIVVAKNVWYGAEWQFNVMTWDTNRNQDWQVHGSAVLRTPFERNDKPRPLPWMLCARTEGAVIRVKGWRGDESEPTWNDASHTGAVRLPAGWQVAGKPGWYAGHIPPGGTMGMSMLHTTAR